MKIWIPLFSLDPLNHVGYVIYLNYKQQRLYRANFQPFSNLINYYSKFENYFLPN